MVILAASPAAFSSHRSRSRSRSSSRSSSRRSSTLAEANTLPWFFTPPKRRRPRRITTIASNRQQPTLLSVQSAIGAIHATITLYINKTCCVILGEEKNFNPHLNKNQTIGARRSRPTKDNKPLASAMLAMKIHHASSPTMEHSSVRTLKIIKLRTKRSRSTNTQTLPWIPLCVLNATKSALNGPL